VSVYWYGIIIALAIAVGYFVARRLGKHFGLEGWVFDEFMLWVIPAAFIGARLWYVIFNLNYYSLYPGKIFAVWEGGLAIHGGIFAGVAVALIWTRVKKIKFLRFADVMSVALILGQAIGRWANYVNQEAYGKPTDLPWAMYIAGEYRHPTFLYESIWNLFLFFGLYHYLSQRSRSGKVFGLYLAGYSLGRFFIEALRTDSLMLGSFRVAQIVSIVMFVAGIIVYLWGTTKTTRSGAIEDSKD
jgi:prolipoprotein diacylglyceryl transferase